MTQAIRASISVPGVFAPIKIGKYELIDGGIVSNLPVDLLDEFDPDLKIASLTSRKKPIEGGSVVDVVLQSINLIAIDDWERQKQNADIRIEPNVENFINSDFFKVKELIKAGESATRAILPELKAKIGNKQIANLQKKINKHDLAIIRSISFVGLKTVKVNSMKRRMQLSKGDKLEFHKLIDDLTKIYYSNLFDHIDYDVQFNETKDSVDLIVNLHEKAYGFYTLGVRYDNFDGAMLGLEVGQGNIKGSCAEARAAFLLSDDKEIRLGINGTRLHSLPIGYRLDGFWRSTKGIFDSGPNNLYKFKMLGGIIETGYILGNNAFFNFGFVGYQIKYEHRQNQAVVIGPQFQLEYNNFNDRHL
ncbi:MAG: patatin-like phospholipase family protein, partial [candidate division WOR-3 bacterium]|nr:patatin-like phospholipase family protein [candidate division WOR-3 bacterium]